MAQTHAGPGFYEFRQPPNVRAWVISAGLVVVGVVSVGYFWGQPASVMKFSLPLVAVLGVAFLLVLAFSERRSTVRVWLDSAGLKVVSPDQTVQALWTEITQIGLAPDHSGVVLARGPKRTDRIRVLAPAGVDDADAVVALTREIQAYVAHHQVGTGAVTVETAPERAYVSPNEADNAGFDKPFNPLAPGAQALAGARRRKGESR